MRRLLVQETRCGYILVYQSCVYNSRSGPYANSSPIDLHLGKEEWVFYGSTAAEEKRRKKEKKRKKDCPRQVLL